MTTFDHNQICTLNNEIIVGNIYQFYEGCPTIIANCKVIADNSNADWIEFELECVDEDAKYIQKEVKFTVSASRGQYAYSGMWRIYDKDTYQTGS